MYFTYLRRELGGRKKQTIIIAAGMALAIALVIIVTAVSAGVKSAQATTLASVYGVGTDITVSETQAAGSGTGGQQFAFGSGDGSTAGGTQSIAQDRLMASRGTATYASSALAKVLEVDGVSNATATLTLEDTSFSGSIPVGTLPTQGTRPSAGSVSGDSSSGGTVGGGGDFSVDSFTVTGIDPTATSVGPLTSAKLTSGRALTAADNGTDVAVIDASYAKSKSLKTGSTLTIGGATFTVVGIVTSTSSDATTASDTYIPLTTAQTLATLTDQVSTIYVSADSSSNVTSVQKSIEAALPKVTVSTQADLAASVSGSLSTASNLLSGLGTWLSALVLAAAFLIATLFTISGVTRRTREFGTLKAIGWNNGRIVRQVAGESLVQGLIGGAIGVAVGLIGILVINIISPVLSSTAAATTTGAGPGGLGGATRGPGAAVAATVTDVVLNAPITIGIILIAVGLSVLGGLLAGAIGGWRASRLRPAEALRSVA